MMEAIYTQIRLNDSFYNEIVEEINRGTTRTFDTQVVPFTSGRHEMLE